MDQEVDQIVSITVFLSLHVKVSLGEIEPQSCVAAVLVIFICNLLWIKASANVPKCK